MSLIIYSLLINPFLALSFPSPQPLPKSRYECSITFPAPSIPSSCAVLVAQVLAEPWAQEYRTYSRFEHMTNPTHLPHVIRYRGCQLTLASAPGQENVRVLMKLAEHKGTMETMVRKCILKGFPGAVVDVCTFREVRLTISGLWDPLVESGLGYETNVSNAIL